MRQIIKIVEFEGKKMFDCEGLKTNLSEWNFNFPADIRAELVIMRQGKVIDRAVWQKVRETQKEWESFPLAAFCGFQREEFCRSGNYKYIFEINELQFGDVLIVETDQAIDIVRPLLESWLFFPCSEKRAFLVKSLPYRGLNRRGRNIKYLRQTWDARVHKLEAMLKSGEMPYLDFCYVDRKLAQRRRNSANKARDKKIELVVVLRKGQYFFEHKGYFFDCIYDIQHGEDEYAWCEVIRDEKVISHGALSWVGTHGAAIMFNGFVGVLKNHYSHLLLAAEFIEGDKIVFNFKGKWNLLDKVIETYTFSSYADRRVKRMAAAYPTEEDLDKVAGINYLFKNDLLRSIEWDRVALTRKFVLAGKVKFMRFEN
ncbi:hypothetical protein HQ571_03580 [Candidatus Kuenenbacteria bacterium]|nr:hypothetical protein [Candidatus Kuenenbacteria bacterium]